MTTEAHIESRLIAHLQGLKYAYRPDIKDKAALLENFRQKFNALNRCQLTTSEFARLRDEIVSADVFKCAQRLRERETFFRDDGTPLQYTLVNIKEWCRNEFEVVHQVRMNTDNSHHRYDVMLLINGIPVVQIELKSLEVSPRKAMKQIVDYKSDPGNGYTNSLLCFVQLFIVSNESQTRYFANNNNQHFAFDADEQYLPVYEYALPDNSKKHNLFEFADLQLSKCNLAELISKYMVLVASEQKMLIMRPYQIYAVKAIVDCIQQNRGNGYIWHTTGSGKTLTSFKASTLLKDNPNIDKCLFVVDRKDLDRQTREEFNKFQDGCVEENTNTETLVRRMLSTDYSDKVIVTTIQKLGLALDPAHKKNFKERLEPLRDQRMVFIFDECHRSQFGDNHKAIKEFFPKAQLFGFTGTPIFEDNASYVQIEGEVATLKTTEEVFEKELHAYTITHAIEDKNVLRFHVDYFKGEEQLDVGSSLHKTAVVKAILDKHDAATHHRRFNAVFATGSINDAIAYYQLFKDAQRGRAAMDEEYRPLNIACVFSPPAMAVKKEGDANSEKNAADIRQIQEDLPQEKADNEKDPEIKKAALEQIIADYNTQYSTNHRITEFDLYYQNVQQRIKFHKFPIADYPREKRIDIIIVVDMLLTGFDSKYLNTLYVDKNLKYHGLIQAFSRTNRILNESKPYGNVLDFRAQEKAVDDAIKLFSGAKKDQAKEVWLVAPAAEVIKEYREAVAKMGDFMQQQNLVAEPAEVYNVKGDAARIEFVQRFKEVQRLKNHLDQYTDLSTEQKDTIEKLMPSDTMRSFRASYLETAKQLQERQAREGDEAPEAVQQLDLELVLFNSAVVDYDYIMGLISDFTQDKPSKEKISRDEIKSILSSDAKFTGRKDEIIAFVDSLKPNTGRSVEQIKEDLQRFIVEVENKALADMAAAHGLEVKHLKAFVEQIMGRMIFDGEELTDLLAPLELGWKDRRDKELALMQDLLPQLKKQANGREIAGLQAYE